MRAKKMSASSAPHPSRPFADHPQRHAPVRRHRLVHACASVLAVWACAGGALAQESTAEAQAPAEPAAQASATDLDQVTVTASRVMRGGFSAPTPTTSITTDEINATAATNVAEVVNQMPSVRPSLTPVSTTNNSQYAGGYYLDLRGLGFNRTLVLVDGKRVVPTQIQGPVDINSVPQALISSVDIVTGGASAAWGSDAVAGVVNFRFDRGLEGFKGLLQAGTTRHGDRDNNLGSIAFGHAFADGRGHLLLAAESASSDGIERLDSRDWGAAGWGKIANPAYTPDNDEPRLLLVRNTRDANRSYGGVINSGPLKGIQFDADGNPIPFEYGDLVTKSSMVGGDGADGSAAFVLEAPLERQSTYGRVSYEFSPAITGFVEASWAKSKTRYDSLTRNDSSLTIKRDNAFLPDSIAQSMDDLGLTSFTMGRYNRDYARAFNDKSSETARFVAGLEGYLDNYWSWDAYVTHGESETNLHSSKKRITSTFEYALDSIIDPVTGAAVCRDAAARAEGCQPINLFGEGAPSQQARDYVLGTSHTMSRITQDAASATLRGEPFETWAGPVSMATGLEWRREKAVVTSDPLSMAGAFNTGNTVPWSGSVTVKEAFGELVVPLAVDTAWADSLDLNLAARMTDYSTSGTVVSWKLGSSWQVNDLIRFRATQSRDIRAPSLAELFGGSTTAIFNVFDPELGSTYSVQSITSGNAELEPEEADTTTAGIVLNPLPDLVMSLDYYRIDVDKAITTFQARSIVERCYDGQTAVCDLIVRDPVSGEIDHVNVSPQNLQTMRVSGADFELSYSRPVGNGQLGLRSLLSYVDTLRLDDGQNVIDMAGSTDQPTIASIGGSPRWRGNLYANYRIGDLAFNAGVRHVGGGRIKNEYTAKDMNILTHSGRTYFDLGGSYDFHTGANGNISLFASVRNVFDKDPPITGTGGFPTVRSLYDVIGRTYNVGVRFDF
ncbi:TonB-dependent receptor plug domain-containing protein [Lysobacter maris]|uniref:TonB-dependent receptor plug domain-containing protein n=1 Tax=Marilutibacter maris TaxID=1605891 RepID=A0A508AWW8_9GAMM|nr:TonB-dependent receptor plug domain-containing protein [Lysobacter maris]